MPGQKLLENPWLFFEINARMLSFCSSFSVGSTKTTTKKGKGRFFFGHYSAHSAKKKISCFLEPAEKGGSGHPTSRGGVPTIYLNADRLPICPWAGEKMCNTNYLFSTETLVQLQQNRSNSNQLAIAQLSSKPITISHFPGSAGCKKKRRWSPRPPPHLF